MSEEHVRIAVAASCKRPPPEGLHWTADRHASPDRLAYAWQAIIAAEPGSGEVTLSSRRLSWSGTVDVGYRFGAPKWDDLHHPEAAAANMALMALRFAAMALRLEARDDRIPRDVRVTLRRLGTTTEEPT